MGWRVWLVTDVYPPGCGGSGWSTHALARVLRDRGHRVSVIGTDPSHSSVRERRYEDIEIAEVGMQAAHRDPRRRLGARDYSYRVLRDYLETRLRREPDVDILHAQHLHSGPPAIDVGRAQGRATVVTLRDYWPVCLHGTSWWGSTTCDGCSTVNLTSCMQEYWKWPRPLARLMVGWARRRLDARQAGVRAAHAVIAVSHAARQRIERDLSGTTVSVVPNMVDPALLEATAAAAPETDAESPYLLTAGKLQPTKGFNLLLDALAEVGSLMPVLIAGDGPMRRALEEQARALRVPARFLGWVDHDRLVRLQKDAHAVVLPSAWDEPLSRIVLETMALGVPVVAWARGGNPEMIEPGVSGWLVRRAEDLARAMGELASPDRRHEVALGAKRRIASRYTPDVVYPAVAAAYEAALERAGRR
jgi:glycosyltransferase involved in cell wall biosynthesis